MIDKTVQPKAVIFRALKPSPPVFERHPLVWLWPGDPVFADSSTFSSDERGDIVLDPEQSLPIDLIADRRKNNRMSGRDCRIAPDALQRA